jgi:hypothetical protein
VLMSALSELPAIRISTDSMNKFKGIQIA